MSRRLALALAAALAAPAAQAQSPADLVIVNARVHTLDAANAEAEAVAVKDGKILAVGSNAAITALAGPSTRRIDAAGRTVIPGLHDSHIHLSRVGFDLRKVPVSDLRTLPDLLARFNAFAARIPKGEWLESASDWHESQLAENRFPTRAELDEAVPDHPVLIRRGGHNAVINSVAMRLAGIGERDADPEGGQYHRDANGVFDGWLLENPAIDKVTRLLPKPSPNDNVDAIRTAMRTLNAAGITTVRDMSVSPEDAIAWFDLVRSGEASLRGHLMIFVTPRRPVAQDIAVFEALVASLGRGDDRVRIGGLKIVHDGGVENNLTTEDYAIQAGYRGIAVTPASKIREVSDYACRNGWQMGVHALGDQAIRNVLDIWEAIDKICPLADRRWGIEHPYLLDASTIARMKALGLTAFMQTPHNYTLGVGWVQYWGPTRANISIQNRTLIDAGLLPAGGTDAPVTPFNPFLAVWTDVTRQTAGAGILGAQEAVTPLEALKMHTIWAARGSFLEDKVGSIEPGKYADLVIVPEDPLAIDPSKIRDLKPDLTMLEGRVVFER